MSGHSKWHQIKHKKEATDARRSAQFTKTLTAIRAAAREDPNPDFNPRLRSLLERARDEGVPRETIERALERARSAGTEELLLEAYGPGGSAFIVSALTDNKNRTVAEVKKILSDHSAKLAEPGSVRWLFERDGSGAWRPRAGIELDAPDRERVARLIEALEEHADVLGVSANTAP